MRVSWEEWMWVSVFWLILDWGRVVWCLNDCLKYTGSAIFMATHILSSFSIKNQQILKFIRLTYCQWHYNNNQTHLFNMAPLFLLADFNLPWKASQQARNTSWGIKAHSRSSSKIKLSGESWGVLQTLLSRIDHTGKSRGFKTRLLEGHSSLLMNVGMWAWIQLWVILEPYVEEAARQCRKDRKEFRALAGAFV